MQDPVRVEDLFPSALDLFRGSMAFWRRQRLAMLAWVIAGALAALVGRRLLTWADHNL